jgi:hypothetical protein
MPRRSTKEVAVPKPYSILAAALVASGRSLSTVTIAASTDRRALWLTGESAEWFADSDRMDSVKFEAPFAMDPSAVRAPANAAAFSA